MFVSHKKAQSLADKALNKALAEMRGIQGALDKRINGLVAENEALKKQNASLQRGIDTVSDGLSKLSDVLGYDWVSEAVKVEEENPLNAISSMLGLTPTKGKEVAKLKYGWVKKGSKDRATKVK